MLIQEQIAVELRPWAEQDLPLLARLMGDPAMTEYLGGPESPEVIRARHKRYLMGGDLGQGSMFAILVGEYHTPGGMIGYWEHDDDGLHVWETGWSVLREFQGKGVATQAARLVAHRARLEGTYRYLHAFSHVENAASNAVCRKAGFELLGQMHMEYPAGVRSIFNNWRLDLFNLPSDEQASS